MSQNVEQIVALTSPEQENILSKPIDLSYPGMTQDGLQIYFNNTWTIEYIPTSKVFCFHDGGRFYFDAENGNYLGERKPVLNKSGNYSKTPKRLSGDAVIKFIQMYDAFIKGIPDIGMKGKKLGIFKSDISNECAGFIGRFRSERLNIMYYMLEDAFENYTNNMTWKYSPVLSNDDFDVYKGFVDDSQAFGISFKGKEFDKRKKAPMPIFLSNPTKYNSEDVKTLIEYELNCDAEDVKKAALVSSVCLEKILSKFRSSIREEDRKKILTNKLIELYKQGINYYSGSLGLMQYNESEMNTFKTGYDIFKGPAKNYFLSLLKSLLVIDNCREIVEEKADTKKTNTTSLSKGGKKGPVLNKDQQEFNACVGELKELFKNRPKIE
ncbi:Uncharacterised protein [Candidatus Tiddalikarchaeum anstoanum]|nr:Uncharacterised protein [Candidatus Tiddalikarchaeum anstoanum]